MTIGTTIPIAAGANGVLNDTVNTTPTKVLEASMDPGHRPRRCFIDNPSAAETLAFLVVEKGLTSAAAMTATAAGADTNGIVVRPATATEVTVPHNCELWLVSTAAGGSRFQLAVSDRA